MGAAGAEEERGDLPEDDITRVLRECEATLRTLAEQGRLTADALESFVQLSQRVSEVMERRSNRDDRRQAARPVSTDRRAVGTSDQHCR